MSQDPVLDGAIRTLRAATEMLRRELGGIPESEYLPMPSSEHYQGGWDAFHLRLPARWMPEYPGLDLERNRSLAPATWSLLRAHPELELGSFLRLMPGATLASHVDFRDDDVIRLHLALAVPEGSDWPLGELRILDIREPHAAANPGSTPRITFCCDVRLPAPFRGPARSPW